MTATGRWIIVDDNDNRIQYSEGWQSVGGDDYDAQGNITGATHNNSLHGTSKDDARLSFTFIGTAARILGTIDTRGGAPNVPWLCVLEGQDGTSIIGLDFVYPEGPENNWVYCDTRGVLKDDPNVTRTISLIAKTTERELLFDYILYQPPDTVTVENETVQVYSSDLDISYDGSWEMARDGRSRSTMVQGSSATFRFNGTGISLFTTYDAGHTPSVSTPGAATYSIDGYPPTTFEIPAGASSIVNRKILELGFLSMEEHTLVLNYTGAPSVPLVIDYFRIEKGMISRPVFGSATFPLHGQRKQYGAIIGGSVIAAITVLFLVFFCLWYFRRRRLRSGKIIAVDQPFTLAHEIHQGAQSTPPVALMRKSRIQELSSQDRVRVQHPAARSKRSRADTTLGNPPAAPAPNPGPIPLPGHPNSEPTPTRPGVAPANESVHDNEVSLPLPPNAIFHEDSGVRIPSEVVDGVLEFPPVYTAT